MLQLSFRCGDLLGLIRRANARLDAFDTALIQQKLYKVYGNVVADLGVLIQSDGDSVEITDDMSAVGRPEVLAGLIIFNTIQDFAAIAPRVVAFEGAPVPWASSHDTPEALDVTFRYWLGDEALQAVMAEALQALDNPNGVEAGAVTATQAADPLSGPDGGPSSPTS